MRIAISLLLASLLAACMSNPRQPAADSTFIVVRHAEKATDDPRDPALTETGRARADALAASLSNAPLVAAYATAFRRTQQTAAPSARAHALTVITYDAKQPAAEFAAQLKGTHRVGIVLVVGHSNTVPDIAAALCDCQVPRMNDTEYDRRMTIRIAPNGAANLTITRD
ncbi:MAG: histidine phosphatase family protein [Lysobacter sp.]|nr:histidine phosphatase family protein [Lysobacter sp.]